MMSYVLPSYRIEYHSLESEVLRLALLHISKRLGKPCCRVIWTICALAKKIVYCCVQGNPTSTTLLLLGESLPPRSEMSF